MLGSLITLLLVSAALGGLLVLIRRRQGNGVAASGLPFSVLRRLSLGPRQGVVLLRVGERVLVLAVADRGAQLITELDGGDRDRALDSGNRPTALALPPKWGRVMAGLLALVLVVGAAPLSAQRATPTPSRPQVQAPSVKAPSVAIPAGPKVELTIGDGPSELKLSGAVGVVIFLGAMTLLPALFLLMTSFTRIVIVLHFLRSALGTQTTPPSQLLVALAVLLTGVVMNPVVQQANDEALQPYLRGQLTQVEAYKKAIVPFRTFMLANTRDKDLTMFAQLSGNGDADSVDQVPTITITSAFVTSELRTSFQMGFMIFLPFIVVDLLVASVLMSMGMFMLPPVMISLPFKLLLFVLADGWTLVVQNLAASFRT